MTNKFSTTDSSQAGYFRIGSVVLQVPPTDISTNRVVNDDQVSTLRSGTPMFVKTGQARWDVTVRWRAVRYLTEANTDDVSKNYDYSQWMDLRRIVAMFKASPFVEVENDFLRQHFTGIQEQYRLQRMAFALRQLRVDTSPDSINVLDVTLTMSLFNYAPYSKDFGYVGDIPGMSVNADASITYDKFISKWILENMDTHPASHSSPPISSWTDQDEGTLTFKWRTYVYRPFTNPVPATTTTPVAAGAPASLPPTPVGTTSVPTTSRKASSRKVANDIQQIIDAACANPGPGLPKLDTAIVTAQCIQESGGKGSAVSPKGALGYMQLMPATFERLGGTDVHNAKQNIQAGCKYLAQQLKTFGGNYKQALAAYNAGPGAVIAYRDGKTLIDRSNHKTINPNKIKTPDGVPPYAETQNYVRIILANAGRADLLSTVPVSVDKITPPPSPAAPTVTPIDIVDKDLVDAVNAARKSLPAGTWWLDHYSELGAFFYEEEQFTLASVDAINDVGDFNMYPSQISVVMVNNLPALPLAAMQYPVFQHVGPTDTMISMGLTSVGDNDGALHEPHHPGIEAITDMSSQLEEQFIQLRTAFRAVSSIHRMQAVFIENQVLNLLGISSTMVRGLNTETVPEAANLVQATVMASQYENIFEETGPYQMNGIMKAYVPVIKDMMTSGILKTLSKEELNAITEVKEFSDAWTSHDESFLLRKLLNVMEDKIDILSSMSTPPTDIWFSDRDSLFNNLDLRGKPTASTNTGSTGLGSTLGSIGIVNSYPAQGAKWPGLQIRRGLLQGKPIQMNYSDYFVLSQLPNKKEPWVIDAIRSKTETKFASRKPAILEEMYTKLFDEEIGHNPLFSRQAGIVTRGPLFKSKLEEVVKVGGPAAQKYNVGHECYKDLGITDYNIDAASYMVNFNLKLNQDTVAEVTKIMGTSNQTAGQVNEVQSVRGRTGLTDAQAGTTFTSTGQALPGQASTLIRMMNIPAYSLNSAFPTYKLLLLEEDNSGPFFGFDNFYSYASVLDIEVIKYRDQPDEAVIQITNLAHLLQHRLYDDTAAGKMERQADKFSIAPGGGLLQGPNVGDGSVGTGGMDPSAGISASKTVGGIDYQALPRKNMAEGRGEVYKRVPLRFFSLQTGSKIQVRLGFSNNPDNLFPVFTGQVTQIDGDEILTLRCQSFQLELMNTPGKMIKKNSHFGFSFSSGVAAFGGYGITSSGDSASVMKAMLSSPVTRHFGRWQVGQDVDKKLKGFEWSELLGEALDTSSNKTIAKLGALLQSGYDRSAENILINSVINVDTSKTKEAKASNAARRTFNNENPNAVFGTAQYSIPKDSTLSIWDIIKDVSRRYPWYNLMVKDYGFPYGADATLVYAHPLDSYYSRPLLFGEAEKEKANNITQGAEFAKWWSATGSELWQEAWKDAFNIKITVANPLTDTVKSIAYLTISARLKANQASTTGLASSGPQGLDNAVLQLHEILTGTTPLPAFIGPGSALFQGAINVATKLANSGNITQKFYLSVDEGFKAVQRAWESYLQSLEPASNSSRIKYVRKYHLIDHNHIIHNGMSVNDKIYNSVKIKDRGYKFNQNVPDQHIRVLDATELVNDPDMNVFKGWGEPMGNAYGQSFLREEVGKMYTGELVLRGVPEIEPFDVILLNDMSTGTIGPIEVDTVIHSFSVENGYVTIVKPRLLLLLNESVSLGLMQTLGQAWSSALSNYYDFGAIFNPSSKDSTWPGKVVGGLDRFVSPALGLALIAWNPPAGITLVALGLLAGAGFIMFSEKQNKDNFFKLMPLTRFGRPWIGGLQGFDISNFAYSVGQSFKWFEVNEISPVIESWNELMHYRMDYVTGQELP